MHTPRLVFFSILLLAACTPDFPPPELIAFESDPRILRGEWSGEAVLGYPITPLVYSPDGSRLFLKKAFINAIYDTATFEVATTLELDATAGVSTAQFSLDSSVLATTERKGYSEENVASLWDVVSGERLETFSLGGDDFVGFSRDLAYFATQSEIEDGTEIAIYDANSQQFLYSFVVPKGYAQTIEVSPDLSTVAVFENREGYTESLSVNIWATDTGENLLELSLDPSFTSYNLLYSPDGALLAITYGSLTRIRDVAAGTFLPDLSEAGTPLAFSADADKLVTKANQYVRFWDVQAGVKIEEVELEVIEPDKFGAITEQAISSQLDQVARGVGDQLQVADLNTGDTLAEITLSQPLDLQLSLEATYVDETSYTLSGTLQYDGERYNVQGDVSGGGSQRYLRPTTSLPPEASFRIEALNAESEVRWLLEGLAPYQDTYGPRPDEVFFGGDIVRPNEGWSHSFSLQRQP